LSPKKEQQLKYVIINLVDYHLAEREVGPEEPMLRDGDESDGGGCSAGRGVVPGVVTTTQMTMMDRTANTAAPATIDMLPAALFVTRSGCKLNSTEMLGTITTTVKNLIMMGIGWHSAEVEAPAVPTIIAGGLAQKFHAKPDRTYDLQENSNHSAVESVQLE
jgi:hypothetical protein